MDALTDPVPDAMADTNSGTRLKAAYVESLDGAKEYLRVTSQEGGTGQWLTRDVWFDTMRNETCYFRMAADGKLRCLPGVPPPDGGSSPYGLAWGDAQCTTTPWVIVNKPPVNCPDYDPPTYAYDFEFPQIQCTVSQTSLRAFKTGAALSPQPNAAVFVHGGGGTCVSLGNGTSAYVVYDASEVDPTQFAEAKPTVKHDP